MAAISLLSPALGARLVAATLTVKASSGSFSFRERNSVGRVKRFSSLNSTKVNPQPNSISQLSGVPEDVTTPLSSASSIDSVSGEAQLPAPPSDDSEDYLVRQSSRKDEEDGELPMLPFGVITVLTSLGAVETSYLTYEKLFGGPFTCPLGGGCSDVLDSSYSSVFGVPLSLCGAVAYSAVALLAQISRANTESVTKKVRSFRDNVRWLLLGLTTAMAAASAYLMYILQVELEGATCTYCYASALLSGAIFLATLMGFSLRELRSALLPQLAAMAAVIFGLSLAFTDVSEEDIDLPPIAPEVVTTSSDFSVALAKHLKSVGAKMYGAFWCSHCYEQKQMFGHDAAKLLEYVECYPEGYRTGVKVADACTDANIEGFPTWLIKGEVLPGEQDLKELARLSGFDASKLSLK